MSRTRFFSILRFPSLSTTPLDTRGFLVWSNLVRRDRVARSLARPPRPVTDSLTESTNHRLARVQSAEPIRGGHNLPQTLLSPLVSACLRRDIRELNSPSRAHTATLFLSPPPTS